MILYKTHKPKKSLGQNFLKSPTALNKIVEAGEIKSEDVVLEIGPGKGALTEKLLERAGTVIAVEKDRELFEFLKTKFEKEINSGSLLLVHDDILEFDTRTYSIETKTYKLIANIPYNITGAILKKFLTAKEQPERMVLLLQREVAQRIVAAPRRGGAGGKESILSISVKAYGEPRMVMKVAARYFSPAPKVDSAVISIKNISRKMFEEHRVNEERFWEIVRAGFAHKRKKAASNLSILPKSISKNDRETLGNKRAEDLSLSDWIRLAQG